MNLDLNCLNKKLPDVSVLQLTLAEQQCTWVYFIKCCPSTVRVYTQLEAQNCFWIVAMGIVYEASMCTYRAHAGSH